MIHLKDNKGIVYVYYADNEFLCPNLFTLIAKSFIVEQ
jgi:hypothetical protein